MKKILIIDSIYEKHFSDLQIEKDILHGYDLDLLHVKSLMDIPISLLSQADGIILWGCASSIDLNSKIIDMLEKCKIIVKAAVGFENIDIDYARFKNIPVYNIPDYGTEEVADHATALLLSLNRKITLLNSHVKENIWEWINAKEIPRLRGKSLGIIGFGRIGQALALRAKPFGLKIGFYDPIVNSGIDKSLGVFRYENIENLLSESDFISIHCSLNQSSYHLINTNNIECIKKGAVLINTARGAIVSTSALKLLLEEEIISFAGFDVLENEPNVDLDIVNHKSVVVTPHSAFYSSEAFLEMRQKSSKLLLDFYNGKCLRDKVN
ncbi:C-terminal binding protein [Mannheimia pernigra]|uniref:C-terminal binding protein n=1 Tax=Mannheimia pernigra TaxID=111844 RepID=A0ABD7A760_9PAST|nr:C-terminal binding protein [Mannheimia pernigra]QLB41861.1 C-terminal binding protein [Mannheimia pernigra]